MTIISALANKIKQMFNNQVFSYAFFGMTTTLVNLCLYFLLALVVDYKIANIIAIVTCKIYSYFVNKLFVFHSHCKNVKEVLKEVLRYIVARGITGVIDFVGLILLVEIFFVNKQVSKIVITLIVIVLNYILGKKSVFREREE